jgi:hypothetical protein
MSLMDIMTIFFYMLVGLGAFIIVIPMIYNYKKKSPVDNQQEHVFPEKAQWQPREFDNYSGQNMPYYAMEKQSLPNATLARELVPKPGQSESRLTLPIQERKRSNHPGKNWSSHWN